MTEDDWLTPIDRLSMWHYARDRDYLTIRKSRLLAVSACREFAHLVSDARLLRMIDVAEQWADGTSKLNAGWWDLLERRCAEAEEAADSLPDWPDGAVAFAFVGLGNDDYRIGRTIESVAAVSGCPAVTAGVWPSRCPQVCRLIREMAGNPFRPVSFDAAWLTSEVVGLAEGIYTSHAFDRMPIIADALQEAGCEDVDVLSHCRGDEPHGRGCWVIDLVLGKS